MKPSRKGKIREDSLRLYQKGWRYFVFTRWLFLTVLLGAGMVLQKMYFGPYRLSEIPSGFFLPMIVFVAAGSFLVSCLNWYRLELSVEAANRNSTLNETKQRPQQDEDPKPDNAPS